MQTADSSFSAIVTSLNTAVTLGTSGASGTVSTANNQAIATELEGVLSSVVAQGNASYQGVYLFAGSASSTLPLVPASTTYTSLAGTVAPPLTARLSADCWFGHQHQRCVHRQDVYLYCIRGRDPLPTFHCCCQCCGRGHAFRWHDRNHQCQRPAGDRSNSNSDGIVVTTNDPALGAMNATPGTEVANSYAYVGNAL